MEPHIFHYDYNQGADKEFVEIAVPKGTDTSDFRLYIYDDGGSIRSVFELGELQGTDENGMDIYVLSAENGQFAYETEQEVIHPTDALALVDGEEEHSKLLHFVSHSGTEVTAQEGPAAGSVPQQVGGFEEGQSIMTKDGGETWQVCEDPAACRFEACYAAGTRIVTPDGPVAIEDLRIEDLVVTRDKGVQAVCWLRSGAQVFEECELHEKPVKISKDAIAPGRPNRDLIVSGQHRIAVGIRGQFDRHFPVPAYVPAKALVGLPGIVHLSDMKKIKWFHFACQEHAVVVANNLFSETLHFGKQVLAEMSDLERQRLSLTLGYDTSRCAPPPTALPCLTKGQAQRRLAQGTSFKPDPHLPNIARIRGEPPVRKLAS